MRFIQQLNKELAERGPVFLVGQREFDKGAEVRVEEEHVLRDVAFEGRPRERAVGHAAHEGVGEAGGGEVGRAVRDRLDDADEAAQLADLLRGKLGEEGLTALYEQLRIKDSEMKVA